VLDGKYEYNNQYMLASRKFKTDYTYILISIFQNA